MVSRRNYGTMITVMLILFFLMVSVGVSKSRDGKTVENEALREAPVCSAGDLSRTETEPAEGEPYVLLLSGEEETERTVSEWCRYTRTALVWAEDWASASDYGETLPSFAVVSASAAVQPEAKAVLEQLREEKISVVFYGLPEASELRSIPWLRDYLGIEEVRAEETPVEGYRLYSGFLLGGTVQYEAEGEAAQKRWDLAQTMPWYLLKSGAKTYMVGMLGEETDEELWPAVLWRYVSGGQSVFCMNLPDADGETGLGLLSAMSYEMSGYQLYPVVDAQVYTMANFPVLASENDSTMETLYSNSQKGVSRDTLWPDLVALSDKKNVTLSCMAATKLDAADEAEPETETLTMYLEFLEEQQGELGLSAARLDGLAGVQELTEEGAWLEEADVAYVQSSAYLPRQESQEELECAVEELLSYPQYAALRTVVADTDTEGELLSFVTENVTGQKPTSDGVRYSDSDDLRMRCVQTALAYSNVLTDMSQALWPQNAEDVWNVMGDEFARNINTYWKPFGAFDSVTATESDRRIRSFLCVEYEQVREGNTIFLTVEPEGIEARFLLRTHDERLTEVTGGSFVQVEENAYLIEVQSDLVTLTLSADFWTGND